MLTPYSFDLVLKWGVIDEYCRKQHHYSHHHYSKAGKFPGHFPTGYHQSKAQYEE